MQKVGIIGGVTWLSTIDYYRMINEKVNHRLGGINSAELLISSVNFDEVIQPLRKNDWDTVEKLFTEKATEMKLSGTEFLAICSNTIAKIAKNIAKKSNLKLIDIIGATAYQIKLKGLKKVGFLGTGFSMKNTFYAEELSTYGIDTVMPNGQEIACLDQIIFKELAHQIISEKSRKTLIKIIHRLVNEMGVEGVVLGCTELPLLLNQKQTEIPLFNTTKIHVDAIINVLLKPV